MATVSSVNNLKIAIALAERQVQRDQSQVQQDAARLDQSQNQLDIDQRQLNTTQDQSRAAQATTGTPAPPKLQRAIETQAGKAPELAKAAPAPAKAQLNTQGETIGKLINTVA